MSTTLTHTGPPPEARAHAAPLSFAQQRQWVLYQLEPGNPAYNLRGAYRVTGRIDLEALCTALHAVTDRHDVLRTTFAMEAGVPVQRVSPEGSPLFETVDITDGPAALEAALRAAMRAPFDLEAGPLLRMTVFCLGPDEHVMLFVMHHIVSDGWSVGLFLRELADGYAAALRGALPAWTPLPIQYADYARRERAQAAASAHHLAYWQHHLAGLPPALELPTDRPRPRRQTYTGARHTEVLSTNLATELRALARQERVSLFMVLLAAYGTLLHRYAGQTDLAVGTPVAHRTHTDVEGLIGFFVNTLVLRLDLGEDPTFQTLLRRVRNTALDAFDHQDTPFEQLVEVLAPARDQSRTPLFQALFTLQNAPFEPPTLPELQLERLELDSGTAKYDLSLYMEQMAHGLVARWEYNTALFDRATVERMAQHFIQLLEGLMADPTARLSALPLMTEAERQQLLVGWNDTEAPLPPDAEMAHGIHQLFEAQAARTPDAPALHDGRRTWSFETLNRRANQLAYHLRARGVGAEVPVALYLPRSAEAVMGMLAVYKAGGAYLPLDPTYPTDRLAFMLEDSSAPVVLTRGLSEDDPLCAHLRRLHVTVLDLAAEPPAWAAAPTTNPHEPVRPDQPAYLLYTSGSTGRPKGVCGLHRGLINRFAWMWRAYPFAEGAVGAQKTALSFIDALWETWGPLLRGIPLVILSDEVAQDPQRLLAALAEAGVTRLVLVPSLLRALLDLPADAWPPLPRLRHWTASGEELPPDLVTRFYQRMPDATLINLYGSTEVSADVLCFDTRGQDVRDGVPIGRPIDNTQVYVLDHQMQPVPMGVPGELYVGGQGLARGYWRQPALTSERFLPHPFAETPEARLYRTGDRVRYRPDGTLLFLGRADHQIQLRGYRIEAGEVEHALMSHPAVREAVVIRRDDDDRPPRLVAYLLGPPAGTVPDDLRAYLASRLPPYMIPSAFVVLDPLPRTPSGKLDRRRLPAPVGHRPAATRAAYTPPRNDTERTLARIWSTVLDVTPVGIHDDFFDLGGHSLLALTLLAHVERTFGLQPPLAALFEAPTVARLGALIRDGQPRRRWTHLVEIQPRGAAPPLFCVHNLGGNVLLYGPLARRLGTDRPVYGIQGQGLDGYPITLASVAEMATVYLRELRQVQPEGPYHLLSYCLGSRLVLEMAQQLHAAGQAVAFLGFVDGASPTLRLRRPTLLDGATPETAGFGPPPPPDFVGRVRHHLQYRARQASFQAHRLLGRLWQRLRRPLPDALKFPYIVDVNRRMLRAYQPRPYPGPVTLFRSTRSRALPPDLGWRDMLTGPLRIHDLDGPHEILEEPYVGALAEALRDDLTSLAHEQAHPCLP